MSRQLAGTVQGSCKRLLLVVFWLLATVNPVLASEQPAAEPTRDLQPVIDPEADRLLRAMGDYLDSLAAFNFSTEITFEEVLPSNQKLQYSRSSKVTVRRPDRIYAETVGDLGSKRLWYDGKQFTLLNDDHGFYAQRPVPSTIDTALDYLHDRLGFLPPVSDFIYSDPYSGMIRDTVYGIYVGMSQVNQVPAHHLAFVQKYIDWQLWVEAGDLPRPKKLVITYKSLPSSPQFSVTIRDWKELETVPDVRFVADVQGASRIEFLSDSQPATEAGKAAEGTHEAE